MSQIGNTLSAGSSPQASSPLSSNKITASSELNTNQTASDTAENNISPAYSVEISEEGARMQSLKASSSSEKTASSANTSAQTPATTASSKTASNATASSEDDSEATASSASNLSIYSEYQLEQMLNSGEITQTEYNAEIAKREVKQEAETAKHGKEAANAMP